MADFTDRKEGLGGISHENQIETEWADAAPLITPQELRRLHLWGIPLVSGMRDPETRTFQRLEDPEIKEFIIEAASLAETESGMEIFPRVYTEKHAFDKPAYESYGYFQLRHRPVSGIIQLSLTPANEEAIFTVPTSWIDTGYLHQGQINLLPLTAAVGGTGMSAITAAEGGVAYLHLFGHSHYIPSFWEIKYTGGYKNGLLSRAINQLIGVIAAMEIISNLATTYARTTSTSLGLDGMSQSISGPGPQIFNDRLTALADKRKWLLRRLQRQVNLGLISDNV